MALLAVSAAAAQAEVPTRIEPQVAFYVTHAFGGKESVPAEFGMKFHYGDATANVFNRFSRNYHPALLDLRFNQHGVTALNVSGVNTLMPKYILGQEEGGEEGGGLFSNINWGLVGMAALGGGIYYASENYRDDREEDRERAQSAQSGATGGSGGSGGSGGGTTPISGECLPGDPTGMLCAP